MENCRNNSAFVSELSKQPFLLGYSGISNQIWSDIGVYSAMVGAESERRQNSKPNFSSKRKSLKGPVSLHVSSMTQVNGPLAKPIPAILCVYYVRDVVYSLADSNEKRSLTIITGGHQLLVQDMRSSKVERKLSTKLQWLAQIPRMWNGENLGQSSVLYISSVVYII